MKTRTASYGTEYAYIQDGDVRSDETSIDIIIHTLPKLSMLCTSMILIRYRYVSWADKSERAKA